MNTKKILSNYSDVTVFIVRPRDGGVVTQLDQKRLGQLHTWRRALFSVVHAPTNLRDEVVAKLKSVRLSKPMIVTVMPEACWMNRWKLPETIPGTGVHATKDQLAKSFEIGGSR